MNMLKFLWDKLQFVSSQTALQNFKLFIHSLKTHLPKRKQHANLRTYIFTSFYSPDLLLSRDKLLCQSLRMKWK
jgi:hypothetical protein